MGPRFTIRTALVGLTLAAGFFTVLAYAIRGHAWAISLSVGVLSFLLVFLVHAIWYMLVRTVGLLLRTASSKQSTALSIKNVESVGDSA